VVTIDALHRRVHGQRGERDPHVDQRDDHRRSAVEQEAERLIGQPKRAEQ
jgi:hypothetical protein